MTVDVKDRPVKEKTKITALRSDMVRAAMVASIVEARNTIPILANMLVEASGGELAMTATDLDMSVRLAVPARCEGELATTLDAKKLTALVGASDDGCQIELVHDGAMHMRAGRVRYKLRTLPRDDFPLLAFDGGEIGFSLPASKLAKTLSHTADFECDEQYRHYICGTALCAQGKRLIAVATNGHILAEIDLCDAPDNWPTCILPSKLTRLLARLLKEGDGEATISLHQQSRIRIEWGPWTVTSKLIDGDFPDWKRAIPKANPARRVAVDSASLCRAVGRVAQILNGRSRGVALTFDRDRITLASSSPEHGSAEEEAPADCPVTDLRMGLNYNYLKTIITAAGGDTVTLDIPENAGAPVLVMPQAGGGFVGVIMPMRV